MAGITKEGFVTKTFPQLLEEARNRARILFADKVQVGDVVDVSDRSLLGRLINLDVTGDADLWQLAQQCWLAFDPNSATGISLDNLVQYSGISRLSQSYSTAIGLFSGSNGTLIPSGSVVKDEASGNRFTVTASVALAPTVSSGVTLTINTVSNTTVYSFSYSGASGSVTTVTYTSSGAATSGEILSGLLSAIMTGHPLLSASIVGSTLVVDKADVFQTSTFTVSSNLTISKVKKLGNLRCDVVGAVEQQPNTITSITTPVLGWDSVTNPLAASVGRLTETDEELRLRFRNTKLERSSNILDSLYSALLNLDGVKEVAIYENDTDITDANGVLPHSFLPVVYGGSSQLIGETIWKNKPLGIRSQGNTEVEVTDSQGFPHTIGFETPNPVNAYIVINLSLNPEDPNVFPADGVDQIKQNIIDYAAEKFGVGDDIIFSRLYTPINNVPGHQIDSLYLGNSPSPVTSSNIVVAFNEIGSFSAANITVNI